MKKLFPVTPHTKFIAATSAFTLLIAVATSASAAQLKEARVTQIVNDVKLLLERAAPRPAVVRDLVSYGTAVRTGSQSRSELTFADLTITRLGANTIFSFEQGTREMKLIDGAILFHVPKGSGGATIKTMAVTATITGTTGIGEFHPATTSNPQPFSKWLCLEGTFRLILPNGQTVELGPGKMVTTDGKSFSKVQDFDIAKLVSTSLFFTGFDQPLSAAILDLIMLAAQNQLASLLLATTTTNPLDPTTLVNVISLATTAEQTEAPPPPPPPPPPPTPSKFGALSVITSPNPYVITSGTTITTDPSITTNGVTDFGKIYRNQMNDGLASVFFFGSTSAVDTALDFDTHFNNARHFPGAVFKFTSLELAGNPTISTANGFPNLALISVGDITSGLPGGTLTFSGLDALLLASQDGSINLGSEITFQDIPTLFFYARGADGDLRLTSPVLGTTDLFLYAGRNITFNAGTDLSVGGDFSARTAVGNISISEAGDISTGGSLDVTVNNKGSDIGTGGNIAVSIGGDLTTGSDFSLGVQNTNGQIDNGGNITLTVDGSVSTQGQLSLLVENYNETANPAGHIGTGGNVSLTTGGNLTADSASIAINNRGGGRIDSGVNLTIDIGGALTTLENAPDFLGNTASLSIAISTRYDETAGNTTKSFIGGDAALNFHADSASIGGNLSVFLSDRGGTIDGNALLNFNVTHDVTVTGTDVPNFSTAADIELLNDSGVGVGSAGSPFGGTIHGDATLQVSAANFTLTDPAGSLFVSINNRNGGVIDSNATLGFNLTGNLTTQGSAEFDIVNDQNQSSNGMPGGSIGLAATLDISAANISIGTDFTARILNHRAQGAPGPGAGSIGTDATLNISAGSFAVGGGLDVSIFNRDAGAGSGTGGHIGGDAAIDLDVAGNLSGQGVAEIAILNGSVVPPSPGGTIVGDASIILQAGSIGSTVTPVPDFEVAIQNQNGGTIGGNATIDVTAGNITANSLVTQIDNTGGTIGGDATINVNVSGPATVTNDATFDIFGSDGAASAAINFNGSSGGGGGGNVGGTFLALIDGNGTITFNNANVHADVLKVGALGTNGVLNIGGGTLSADSELKLYAPGSNGQLNFVSNVTLGGIGTKILAANSVTIFNNVVVTIGGSNPADVYTNNANYTGFGGNGSTTGTFAGAGANDPQALSSAPPLSATTVASGSNVTTSRKTTSTTINISSSNDLLSMLDGAGPGRGGKITIPASSKIASNGRNSSRIDGAGRLNAIGRLNADRRAVDIRTASSLPGARRLPQ